MKRIEKNGIIFLILIGLLLCLSSCELFIKDPPIFKSEDGKIVIHTANPKPDDITVEGFTFLVNINLPSKGLKPGDGYRVWIIPKTCTAFDYSGVLSPWYFSSDVLSPKSTDIKRGGWLGYSLGGNNYIDLERGRVASWYISVALWDSGGKNNITYYESSFDYNVVVY